VWSAASSKLQRPAGDRIKTDARDALHLPGYCAWMRWCRCGSPRWPRKLPVTWSAPAKLPGRI